MPKYKQHAESSGALLDLEDQGTCTVLCKWLARFCCYFCNKGRARSLSRDEHVTQLAGIESVDDIRYRNDSGLNLYTHQQTPIGAADISPCASLKRGSKAPIPKVRIVEEDETEKGEREAARRITMQKEKEAEAKAMARAKAEQEAEAKARAKAEAEAAAIAEVAANEEEWDPVREEEIEKEQFAAKMALATVLRRSGELDVEAVEAALERCRAAGCDGLEKAEARLKAHAAAVEVAKAEEESEAAQAAARVKEAAEMKERVAAAAKKAREDMGARAKEEAAAAEAAAAIIRAQVYPKLADMVGAERQQALDSVTEDSRVCTPLGNGRVLKRQGLRLRVEQAGGPTRWFDIHDLTAVASADIAVAEAPAAVPDAPPPAAAAPPPDPLQHAIAALQTLLDLGVLSQEEFDAKQAALREKLLS